MVGSEQIDISNKIVLLKGKDRTHSVRSVHKLSPYQYSVQFKGKPQVYTYGAESIDILPRLASLNPGSYVVTVDGKVQGGVTSLDDYGDMIRIVFGGGYAKSFPKSRVKMIRSALEGERAKEIFEYLKSLAHSVSLRTDSGVSFLGRSYDSIKFIREDTILSAYLSGELRDIQTHGNLHEPIFPFGFNASQKQATYNALNNRISIIEGPPGTGKTQTILNLITNIVMSGQTVAVVSNNNSATDNVYEKLQAEGLDFIAARLGRASNKQDFIQSQVTLGQDRLEKYLLDRQARHALTSKAKELSIEIDVLLQSINERAALEAELQDVVAEQRHFDSYYNSLLVAAEPRFMYKPNSGRLLGLVGKFESGKSPDRLTAKLANMFWHGLLPDRFYQLSDSDKVESLKRLFYSIRRQELEMQIRVLDRFVSDKQLDVLISSHRDVSMRLFRDLLAAKYTERPQKTTYTVDDLWKNSDSFIEDYPVVLSTTHSLRSSLSTQYVYDYVIIDEASQVDLVTFALALSCAKNVVVVGDKKQLPNVIDSKNRRIDNDIFSRFTIPEEYRFSSHSALSGISAALGDGLPTQMLREHYRCHPLIIGFCNKMFYDNKLIVLTPDTENGPMPFSVWRTPPGNHARDDRVNQRQIDVTFNEVVPAEGLNLQDESLGIIAPYRNHASELQKILSHTKTLAATVDKFQGREKDVIILNTVDNKISEFASNPNRLNVAVSRARKRLIVVTDGNENSTGTGIDKLIDYIKYHDVEVEQGATRSIFDYLYKSYYKKKTKRARRDSSAAEDLMYELLRVLQVEGGLDGVDIVMEYPLRELCNLGQLSKNYADFAQLSRVDFVLFDKVSKRPLLAIEVDGWEYHRSNTHKAYKQRINDKKKNEILELSDLPLMRFSTTGSGEKEKLLQAVRALRA